MMNDQSSKNGRLILLLVLIALIPRALFLFQAVEVPLFDSFYLDSASYDRWAQRLAGGEWMGERPFHMAPVYPYILGVYYKLAGRDLLGVRVLQHLMGAMSAALIFLIGRRLFGRGGAWIAFILAAGYGPFVYFEGQLLASALGVFLGVLALWLLIRSLQSEGKGIALAGLALGIGSVARPNLLFFMPLAAAWILVSEKNRFRKVLPYLGAFVIALTPAAIHNYALSGEFILISSHGGISFYLGNNDFTQGTYVPPPEFAGNPEAIDIYDSKRIAERESGRSLSSKEIQGYWYGQSFEWMARRPGDFLKLLARKTLLYLNGYEIPLDVNYEFDRKLYPVFRILPVTMALIIPLALLGIPLAFRAEKRSLLLFLFAAANGASVIAFFVTARYRQTGVPAMLLLAAFALYYMYQAARERKWRTLGASIAAFLLLSIPARLELYPGKVTGDARSLGIVGRAYAHAGEPAKAERYLRRALDLVPEHVDSRMNLGNLYYETGRYQEAVEQFGEATTIAPRFLGAWNNLGNALREAGDPEAALRVIAHALEIEPRFAGGHNNRGYTLTRLGRIEEADSAFRSAIEIDPAMVDAWANWADMLIAGGRPGEGARVLDDGIRATGGHAGLRAKRRALNQIEEQDSP